MWEASEDHQRSPVQQEQFSFMTMPLAYKPIAKELALHESLESYYGDENNFALEKPSDDVPTMFPDGSHWASCGNWTRYVRRLEGRVVQLYALDSDENPDSKIAELCGGHEFAVVDRRYIVDG